jgi:hypothetical protein
MEKMTYDIPSGCDKITIKQIGNQIITEFIPKVEELKDLDCYKAFWRDLEMVNYIIFNNKYNCHVVINADETIETKLDGQYEINDRCAKITREEMQAELAKHGKYFDFEEKVLKSLRWRAEKEEFFFYINVSFEVHSTVDYRDSLSDNMFDIGNYHQTKEQCNEYAKKMIAYSKSLIK